MKGFLGRLVAPLMALIGMGKEAIAPEVRTLELQSLRRVKKGSNRHRRSRHAELSGGKLEKRWAEAYDRGPRGF